MPTNPTSVESDEVWALVWILAKWWELSASSRPGALSPSAADNLRLRRTPQSSLEFKDSEDIGLHERFDLETGASLARRELPAESDTPPVVVDGTIFVTCRDALLALR